MDFLFRHACAFLFRMIPTWDGFSDVRNIPILYKISFFYNISFYSIEFYFFIRYNIITLMGNPFI